MFSESNRYKKKTPGSEISLPQIIILSVLVLALGAVIGAGLLFLRNADQIVAGRNPTATLTPGPTHPPTIAPTATEIPNFSGIEIGIWELPVGFVELSRDEVPIFVDGASIETSLNIPINSQFGYQSTKDSGEKIILIGFTFVLPSAEEQKRFDQHLTEKPEIFEQALHPAEEWLDETQPEEEFLRNVAEKHTFWRFVGGPEEDAHVIDMLVFRRRGVGAVVYLQYPWQTSPNPDIYTTANLLDEQILNVLTKGSMLSSSLVIDADNILETLGKAEKRFLSASSIWYQLETLHIPEGSQVSLTGNTTRPDELKLTIFIGDFEFRLYDQDARGKVILEAVGTDYLFETGVSFNTMVTDINIIVNSAAKLSRTSGTLRREPDEPVGEIACFVYTTEIDVEEFTKKTMVSADLADSDKIYAGTGTAKVWVSQTDLVIQKAHFSIPFTLEKNPEEQGTYEVELTFEHFEE